MKLDFSSYPIIDHHCHTWSDDTKQISKESFIGLMSMGQLSAEEAKDPENLMHSEFTPMGRQILHLMAKFLGCQPRLTEVLETRNKRSRSDYWRYSAELLLDARVEGLFVDDGFVASTITDSRIPTGSGLGRYNFEEFVDKVSVPVRRVARIERRFQAAIDESKNFDDFVALFDQSIYDAVKKQSAIAFKSVIAYRTGLHIELPTQEQVFIDYKRSKETRARDVKHIRDWYVRRVVAICRELGTPLHIHTGTSDIDVILEQSNPIHLYGLLRDPDTWKTKVFLIHAGYPWAEEAAYFANAMKNVYIDLSIPFASIPGAIEKNIQILDVAPPARVVFGSDGYLFPEVHWAAAKIGRQVLEESLGTFVRTGVYDEDEAHQAAKMILSENVRRVYKPW